MVMAGVFVVGVAMFLKFFHERCLLLGFHRHPFPSSLVFWELIRLPEFIKCECFLFGQLLYFVASMDMIKWVFAFNLLME